MPTLPYSKTHAIDQTRGIVAETPIPTLSIASIVESDTGPIERLSNNNSQEFIDNYCTGSSISADDNITLQYNTALLSAVRVDTVRVDTSKLRSGMGSNGTKMYFDDKYNLVKQVTEFKLGKKDTVLDYLFITIKSGKDTTTKYYMGDSITGDVNDVKIDGEVTIENFFKGLHDLGVTLNITDTTAIFRNEIVEVSENLYNKVKELPKSSTCRLEALVDGEGKSLLMNDADYIKVGSNSFYNKNTKTLNASELDNPIALEYKEDKAIPTTVFLMKVAKQLYASSSIRDPLAISAKATYNGETVINDVDKINELIDKSADDADNPIIITDAVDPTKGPSIMYNKRVAPTIVVAQSSNVFTVYDPNDTSYYELTHATDATNDNYFNNENLYIVVDKDCYYIGEKPVLADMEGVAFHKVSNVSLGTQDFIDKVYEALTNDYIIGKAAGNMIIMSGEHTIKVCDTLEYTEYELIDQSEYDDAFAVVCKFTSSKPLFSIKLLRNHDEFDSYTLTYAFKSIESTINFSFDGNAIDGKGNSIFYEKYNEDPDYKNNYIAIVKLDGDKSLDKYYSPMFGDEVLNNPVTEAAYVEAMLKFNKVLDKTYDIVTDAGHGSNLLAQACKQVADNKFALYAPSMPVEKEEVSDVKDYFNKLGIADWNVIKIAPAHKSNYNGNYLVTLPASFSYIMARVNAYKTVSGECDALFGSRKGAVAAPNLVKIYDQDEAQELADNYINVITKDTSGTYIKSNFTSQTVNSYLSEDQNAYMTNVIAHICEEYNPSIIAEVNDRELRDSVERTLTNKLLERFGGKKPGPAGIKVICKDPTIEEQEARKLTYEVWVKYNPTVAYVLAYVYVKRLNAF